MMVGRLLSYWEGIFSGAMLNFQGVFDIHELQKVAFPYHPMGLVYLPIYMNGCF